jgi:hypothetical protein
MTTIVPFSLEAGLLYFLKNFVRNEAAEEIFFHGMEGPHIIFGDADIRLIDAHFQTLPETHRCQVAIKISGMNVTAVSEGFYFSRLEGGMLCLEYLQDQSKKSNR